MILTVPQDAALYPTLGPELCDWIEEHLVFGPGDLRGEPAVIDDEKRALIYRMYEVYPQDHPQAGRRRFKRCAVSLRKGSAKTEFAAWIAACELHPEAPVRCVGWTRKGEPIGGPVTDPYIPLVAYTEEQSDDLAYGALRVILQYSTVANDFDIGLERILRVKGDGKAVGLASAPDARDGARTTFQHFDETHRFTLPRLIRAHQTMLANIPKRRLSDAWSLETTTAPEPGSGSVAEATMDYAKAVDAGKVADSRLFFFHRSASDDHDLTTAEGVKAAVIEASGPVAVWSDIDSIVEQWRDPTTDRAYFERVWLNRLVKGSSQAFDVKRWRELATTERVARNEMITLGFDGSLTADSCAITATSLRTGFQWKAGLWERSYKAPDTWQVPPSEVDATVVGLFTQYRVVLMYADPPLWRDYIAKWAGEFGSKRVVEWWTNRNSPMSKACKGFDTAIREGLVSHDGDKDFERHIGNSRKLDLPQTDEDNRPLWVIRKDRPDSPHKIDLAVAGVLSWEARTDAIADGALQEPQYQAFAFGGRP